MKTTIFILLCTLPIALFGQNPDVAYDSQLADSLGADEYGMKSYIFVLLKTGPANITDQDSLNMLMKGHLKNISHLAEQEKLTVAGPFGKNKQGYRGLFILNSENIEDAEKMLQSDPAIAAGVFESELIPWYGSAALPTYLENHAKIEKKRP